MIEKIFKDIHYQRTPWVKSHSHTGKIPLRKDPSSLRTGSTVNVKWRPLSYIIVKGGGRSNFFRLLDRFDSCQPFFLLPRFSFYSPFGEGGGACVWAFSKLPPITAPFIPSSFSTIIRRNLSHPASSIAKFLHRARHEQLRAVYEQGRGEREGLLIYISPFVWNFSGKYLIGEKWFKLDSRIFLRQ